MDLLPLARIKKKIKTNIYQATLSGDSLLHFSLPIQVYLYQPTNSKIIPNNKHNSFFLKKKDIFEKASLRNIILGTSKKQSKNHPYARLDLSLEKSTPNFIENPQDLWLCFPKKKLIEEKNNIYYFQIKDLPVLHQGKEVASIKSYFETGAHGVLVLKTLEKFGNIDLMIPFIEEYIRIDVALEYVEIFHFFDFLER